MLAVRAGLLPGSCTRTRLAEQGWSHSPSTQSTEKEKRKELRAASAYSITLKTARELLAALRDAACSRAALALCVNPTYCSGSSRLSQPGQPQHSEQGPTVSDVNRCCILIQNIYLVGFLLLFPVQGSPIKQGQDGIGFSKLPESSFKSTNITSEYKLGKNGTVGAS